MPSPSPRDFAIDVVRRLRDEGHVAYWAGGCVRDQLVGLAPKDYDVATDAVPERIREIFGRRRTIAIGAAFGVITVLGPRSAGQIEVATFRQDAAYSDGRHPDAVSFSNAEQDALRRDFTINGLFFDPLADRIIDYVQGREDLEAGIIRAIGDAEARIAEDKLRMLRAIRFTATFDFKIESRTWQAICDHAVEIEAVSGERIAAEMRRMLQHDSRPRAADLLRSSGLLDVILPEAAVATGEGGPSQGQPGLWDVTLGLLSRLEVDDFAQSLAALILAGGREDLERLREHVRAVEQRWRLTRRETADTIWLLENHATVQAARRSRWHQVQPLLADERGGRLVRFARSVAENDGTDLSGVRFCEQKLSLPSEELNPVPLLTGHDLIEAGISPGPQFAKILQQLREEQLQGVLSTRAEALDWLRRWS